MQVFEGWVDHLDGFSNGFLTALSISLSQVFEDWVDHLDSYVLRTAVEVRDSPTAQSHANRCAAHGGRGAAQPARLRVAHANDSL
jgi:hypothetical protein